MSSTATGWSIRPLKRLVLLLSLSIIGCGEKPSSGSSPPSPPPLPVRVSEAQRGDLALHLEALGTVSAFNTTTVKTRVSGELVKIHFREGDTVKAGALLAEIDPRAFQNRLDQALGKLSGDRAQLQFAEAELARDQQLIAKGYIARSELETQSAEVQRLKGLMASDQAEIESARLDLSYCRITAPISGQLGLKRIDVGNVLNALDPLVVLTQMQPMLILFNLPQDEILRLKEKLLEDSVPVEAFDREGQRLLAVGRLASVDNLIDATTGTLRVKAEFPNEDLALYPNQFVNVRLVIENLKERILVPRHALVEGPSGTQAFLVRDDGTVEVRMVVTGPSEGDLTVIESGLDPHQILVTEGLDKLKAGTRVRPLPQGSEPKVETDPARGP